MCYVYPDDGPYESNQPLDDTHRKLFTDLAQAKTSSQIIIFDSLTHHDHGICSRLEATAP